MKSASEARTNDADETRNNILEVAAREFADKGLAGARIDEIAELTSSSKRMIYYYFGGKDGLYRAVLERAYGAIREREAAQDFDDLPADAALREHVLQTFDYHARHPEFVRLVMNENIHHAEHLRHIDGIKDRNLTVVAAISKILDRGVAEGRFKPAIDPVDLHMSISALAFYNVSNRYTFSTIFDRDIGADAAIATRRVQVAEMILAFVTR